MSNDFEQNTSADLKEQQKQAVISWKKQAQTMLDQKPKSIPKDHHTLLLCKAAISTADDDYERADYIADLWRNTEFIERGIQTARSLDEIKQALKQLIDG